MANTKMAIFSKRKPITGKPPTADKLLPLKPDICFHYVYNDDKSDRRDDAAILVKIDKVLIATEQNLQKMTFPVI